MKKIPKSVLVIVYTKDKKILLLKKNNKKEMWQSITGSLLEGENPLEAAKRELYEETGLISNNLIDCNKSYVFEIYDFWKYKYNEGVIYNTEYLFMLKLDDIIDITLDKSEHISYEWFSRVKAAEKVFSHTNRIAIFEFV